MMRLERTETADFSLTAWIPYPVPIRGQRYLFSISASVATNVEAAFGLWCESPQG